MIGTDGKKLAAILGGLLCAALITGCASSSSTEASPTTAAQEVPPYYHDFDREVVGKNVINPCDEVSDEFFKELGLDPEGKVENHNPRKPVWVCNLSVDYQSLSTLARGNTFTFGGDRITAEIMRENYEIVGNEGGWIITNDTNGKNHRSCTASIATKRGRLSVLRQGWKDDKESHEFYCKEALRVAKLVGDYLHNRGSLG